MCRRAEAVSTSIQLADQPPTPPRSASLAPASPTCWGLCRLARSIGRPWSPLVGTAAARVDEPGSTSEREGAMAIFEGPDRNRNIMIIAAAVVIAVFIFLYTTGRVPGI